MIKYQQQKGFRVNRYFFSVYCSDNYWFNQDLQRWEQDEYTNFNVYNYSNYYPCRSVRSFRKKLKKWSEYLPKGLEFRLVNRYVGYDVYGKIK